MKEFIKSTIGLECNGYSKNGKMTRIEFYRLDNGDVLLQPVSGRNLSNMPGKRVVSSEDFADRPHDYYDDTVEARWALNLCGYRLVSEDDDE